VALHGLSWNRREEGHAGAGAAGRGQFEQADGYESVQTQADDLDADRNLNIQDLADIR
jgi:hypothetical protein